jgi:hypothetical protein
MKIEEKYIMGNIFPDQKIDLDEQLFNKMMDFIIELDENQLTEDQLDKVVDIIDNIDFEEEITEIRRAKKTSIQKKIYARKYRKKNRQKIKMKKKKFQRSAEGKKRKRLAQRMAKTHKTPTGRKKVQYHK